MSPDRQRCCPNCGYSFREQTDRERRIAGWRAHCAERGYFITADDRIAESVAAELLEIAGGTLENRRRAGIGPVAFRMGIRGSRWSYTMASLADYVESMARQ